MSLYSDERGAINGLLVPLILAVLLLIGAVFFGAWAFSSRQDYKTNVDAKIATAVEEAKVAEGKVKDAQFAEERKNPLRSYSGPSTYGSVVIQYPNTWSGYVRDANSSEPYIDGYFSPNIVPDTQGNKSSFALRIVVTRATYSESLQRFQSAVKSGDATVQPYSLPKVPGVVGSIVNGKLDNTKQGTMVLLPLRNTTLKIWTESDQFKADFNNIILPNASFSP